MQRDELERLSKSELFELVLRLQRPEKTSRTSSKPPSTDRKERRERAKPGGAKPGHEGHSRPLSDDVSERIAHRPEVCPCCRMALAPNLPTEAAGVWEHVELPAVRPRVVHHHRLAVRCPGCGTRAVAPVPVGGTPFGSAARPSARACTRWPPTSRPTRRSPTSGCRPRSPTCSGCASARAG